LPCISYTGIAIEISLLSSGDLINKILNNIFYLIKIYFAKVHSGVIKSNPISLGKPLVVKEPLPVISKESKLST
jgi:hypothetical protein